MTNQIPNQTKPNQHTAMNQLDPETQLRLTRELEASAACARGVITAIIISLAFIGAGGILLMLLAA